MEEREFEIEMYNGMVYGEKVSEYGLKNGYLDYYTLSKIVGDSILNNTIINQTPYEWELVNGKLYNEVYQDYIISERGYEFLTKWTDEIVMYNEKLNLYIWCIDHFGTSWDYVLTNIKLVEVCY